jgi:hypothetical protein
MDNIVRNRLGPPTGNDMIQIRPTRVLGFQRTSVRGFGYSEAFFWKIRRGKKSSSDGTGS